MSHSVDNAAVLIESGDLWSLAWNGQQLGYVTVSGTFEDYVLGWPTTIDGQPSYKPGIQRTKGTFSGTVWPTLETGIGWHLLSERVAKFFSADEIQSISSTIDEGNLDSIAWAPGDVNTPQNSATHESMIETWNSYCFHTGKPDQEANYLDQVAYKNVGGTARLLGQLLSTSPEETRRIWNGNETLSQDQLEAISNHHQIEGSSFTTSDPSTEFWTRLSHPTFKQPVNEATTRSTQDEMAIRLEASQKAYGLAARDDQRLDMDRKLLDALKRIGS